MKNSLSTVLVAAAMTLGAPVMASTIYSGTINESQGNNPDGAGAEFTLSDFNTSVGDPTLTIGGDTTIFGYVAHQANSTSNWLDGWSMDFGSETYAGVFNWDRVSDVFEGTLTVGSTVYTIDDVAGGTIDLGDLTGLVSFSLDPVAGTHTGGERATWDLSVSVSAVPLPAGAFLMLSGLAGFAAMRRKSK